MRNYHSLLSCKTCSLDVKTEFRPDGVSVTPLKFYQNFSRGLHSRTKRRLKTIILSKGKNWQTNIIFDILIHVERSVGGDRWQHQVLARRRTIACETSKKRTGRHPAQNQIQLNPTITNLKGLTIFICYWWNSVIANVWIKGKLIHGTEKLLPLLAELCY